MENLSENEFLLKAIALGLTEVLPSLYVRVYLKHDTDGFGYPVIYVREKNPQCIVGSRVVCMAWIDKSMLHQAEDELCTHLSMAYSGPRSWVPDDQININDPELLDKLIEKVNEHSNN